MGPVKTFSCKAGQIIKPSYPKPLKVEAVATIDPAHDIQEIRCEDERCSLPFYAKKVLPVTQDVSEVNVKQVP